MDALSQPGRTRQRENFRLLDIHVAMDTRRYHNVDKMLISRFNGLKLGKEADGRRLLHELAIEVSATLRENQGDAYNRAAVLPRPYVGRGEQREYGSRRR